MEMHISGLNVACEPVVEESNDISGNELNNTGNVVFIELCLEIFNLFNIFSVSSNMGLELLWWVFLEVGKHVDFSIKVIVGIFFASLNSIFDGANVSRFSGSGDSVDQIEKDLMVIINEFFFTSIFRLGPDALFEFFTFKDWPANNK